MAVREVRGIFTDKHDGLVPLSGGGIENFLRADGVFAPPAGSGGGTPGPQGEQGETGEQGPPGANGAAGAAGSAGATGPAGANGTPGVDGQDGADGLNGINGVNGAQGADGATGPQGLQGASGPPGADGQDGAEGPRGSDGAPGANGAQGTQGLLGERGPPGVDGQDGEQGPIGPAGATGATGAPGSGGAGNVGTATIDFGVFPGASDASVAVTGQAAIVAGSVANAWIRPAATADHSADEHMMETLKIFAGNIVAGTGFTIYGLNTSQLNEPLTSPAIKTGPTASINIPIPSVGGMGTRIYGQWAVAWNWA